ncbi:MAG: energy transducer TonB [Bacteroidota bacterium]
MRPRKANGTSGHGSYRVRFQLGLVLSLLLVLGLFNVRFMANTSTETYVMTTQETIQIEEIKQTAQQQKPPPPPRPPVPVAVSDDVLLEDIELDLDATLDLNEAVAELPPPPPPPAPEAEAPVEAEAEVFIVVEEMPVLIGGIAALHAELKYPEIAVKAGIEGRVIVQFIVDEEGRVLNPQVLRGLGAGLDEEAIRAISLMQFEPGRQRGVPVRVQYSVPVTFRLKTVGSV